MASANFDKKWFNELFFILNDILKDDSIRIVLVYGGKSASKTVSICQLLAKEAYVHKASTIAHRKESSTIPTTLKKSFNLSIDKIFLYPAFENQDRRYLCCEGSEIVLKGLDDPEKAKGIESFKYVYLDELNQFTYVEFEIFDLSLRGIPGQKIFGSWNPIDENSWVKKKLIDNYEFIDTKWKLPCEHSFVRRSTCGKVVLIKTTYHYNYWTIGSPDGTYGYHDKPLIETYENLKTFNPDSYRINVLGEWGHKRVEKPFAYAYEDKRHGAKCFYDPSQYLCLSFDFNVDPITCTASQHYNNCKYFIKEFRIENSDIYELCGRIKAAYPTASFMVTGDATGRNRQAISQGNITYYMVIKTLLNLGDMQFKQGSINPSVHNTRVLLNSMLQNYNIFFDPDECPYLIRDLKYLEVNSDGDREKVKEGQMGHLIDCLLYDLWTFHKDFIRLMGIQE